MQENSGLHRFVVDPRYAEHILNCMQRGYQNEELPQLIRDLVSGDIFEQHQGVIGITKLLAAQHNPPIQELIDTGIVPYLFELVKQFEYPQLQMEATWTIAMVVSGTTEQCQTVVRLGAVPILVNLLRVQNRDIVNQAVWAIINIAADSIVYRDMLIEAGAVGNILAVADKWASKSLKNSACIALSNLCRGTPLPAFTLVRSAIQYICQQVVKQQIGEEAQEECYWAIVKHINNPVKQDILANEGFLATIINQLKITDIQIHIYPCLIILGFAAQSAAFNESYLSDLMIQNGLFECLKKHINHHRYQPRKEICWTLSNIAAGTEEQVHALLAETELIDKLLQLFTTDHQQVRKQIGYIFAFMFCKGNKTEIKKLFQEKGVLQVYLSQIQQKQLQVVRTNTLKCMHSLLQSDFNNKEINDSFVVELLAKTNAKQILEAIGVEGNAILIQWVIRIFEYLKDHPHFRDMKLPALMQVEGEQY